MLNKKIIIGVCGSTSRTVQCIEALAQHPDQFEIVSVITPPPRPVGRAQVLTPSAVEDWARAHSVRIYHVEKKLSEIQEELLTANAEKPIDILLVVDFGYLIPQWLLDLPRVAPVNIHPSDLPKYRGSSPAQYALLLGETESAVCIMRLVWELDAGPIIRRLPFSIPPTMTQADYYQTAFTLASAALPQVLQEYIANRKETVQPEESPTPIAGRLKKEDGFWPEFTLEKEPSGRIQLIPITGSLTAQQQEKLSGVVQTALDFVPGSAPQILDRMVRAFSPWPGVWGIVPEYKGRKDVRLKILAGQLSADTTTYTITRWQFEGEGIQE